MPAKSSDLCPAIKLSPDRNHSLDSIKGLAIIGVLLLHSSFGSRFSLETLAVQALLAHLFDWSVLAFFFTSGWLHKNHSSFGELLGKRFRSLLVPFFVYNILYNGIFKGLDAVGFWDPGHLSVCASSIWLWPFQSPGFQLYFLPFLFAAAVLASVVAGLGSRSEVPLYGGLVLLALAFYLDRGFPPVSHGPEWFKLPLYLASFALGVILRRKAYLFLPPLGLVCCVLSVVLVLLVFSVAGVSLLVPPLLLWGIAGVPGIGNANWLARLGQHSGCVYLWHTPVLLPVLTLVGFRFHVPSLGNFFLALALTLAGCLLLRWGLDKTWQIFFHRPPPRWLTL